jgi:inorganic phosphate transporter, PiT family
MVGGLAPLSSGIYLGWTLGANNAANFFGTAVATRIITFRKACVLCAFFIILGAILQGAEGIATLSGLTQQNISTAVIVSVSAALTGTFMTYLRIPISTSQAVVGAIFGIGLAAGNTEYNGLIKIIICWVFTPIGSMIFACIAYKLLGWFIEHVPMSMFTRDKILWGGLLIVGTYGSYALGANNVTNCVGAFSGILPGINDTLLAMIGGLAIAAGVLTYSKRVMYGVGSGIMPLNAFTALAAVLGMSITVHVFAFVGAPVSSSQGIVGSIIGIGLLRGSGGLKFKTLVNIGWGWILTPLISLILAAAGYAIFCNQAG